MTSTNLYGAQIVVQMSDGTTKTLTGSPAQTWAMKLDDLEGIHKLRNEDTGITEYYILNRNACGYCKIATLTPTAEALEPDACEDGIPNCAVTAIAVNPAAATVKVGETVKLIAKTTPANQYVAWTTSDAETATVTNGIVKGIKAGPVTITVADAATGTVKTTANITVEA